MSDPNSPSAPGKDSNPDPITGAPGAHPIGTGVGAASAGAVGAAIGAVGGPVGIVVGTAVGAVAGGLAGHSVAESMDPTNEEGYWQKHHSTGLFGHEGSYERYSPAYRAGYEGASRHGVDKEYHEVEDDLKSTYEKTREEAGLSWEKAKYAAREAYDRARASLKSHTQK